MAYDNYVKRFTAKNGFRNLGLNVNRAQGLQTKVCSNLRWWNGFVNKPGLSSNLGLNKRGLFTNLLCEFGPHYLPRASFSMPLE